MPCVVPKEWIAPPDHETADGELLDEDAEDDDADESAGLVESDRKRRTREEERARVRNAEGAGGRRISTINETSPPPRLVGLKTTDTAGRELPAAERAPLPRRKS